MPREVNPPRAYESPIIPRTLSDQSSLSVTSLNRAESAPAERVGVSGLRRGGPFGFHNAVVSRGSTLRNSMKPRPSATDAVIVEKSGKLSGSDSRDLKVSTPPINGEVEGERVDHPSGQSTTFNLMDRENSEVPQSPIQPSPMRRAVSESQAITPNSHAGPSRPRYSARTFFDDEESEPPYQSTTPSAAPPVSYHQTLYLPSNHPSKSSKSRKRDSTSLQPENVSTSPNTRSKKHSRRSHPPLDAFSTPQSSLSIQSKRNIVPRTENPMVSSHRRKASTLSKSLSYPASSATTSLTTGRRRRSTPHVNGRPLKASIFMIPDFVPKGTSMDPDPPPPPPSPGDDPILLVGNRSGILSQPPMLDDLEDDVRASLQGQRLDQNESQTSNSVPRKGERRLAMLNEDEDAVKVEDSWKTPGFEMDDGAPSYLSPGHMDHQEGSESEDDQNPDISYAPGSQSRSFNEFISGLVPGPRAPTISKPLSPIASQTPTINSIPNTTAQFTPQRTRDLSVSKSPFSPSLPNMLSMDEDAENILRFSIPPPDSSRSPTVTRSISYSPFSVTHSRSSQTPVPETVPRENHASNSQEDILKFSVSPSNASTSSSNTRSATSNSLSRARSSRTPVLRSPTPQSLPVVSLFGSQHPTSPIPESLPIALNHHSSVSTPFLNKRSITLNHTPAPTLSPYVFQPPGTPDSYSGSSEDDRKIIGVCVSREDSVDRVFGKLDRQWETKKGGEVENDDEVGVSEWARKIRSSLSPDSEDEEAREEVSETDDHTVVLSHRTDTQSDRIEYEEEVEGYDAVEDARMVASEPTEEKLIEEPEAIVMKEATQEVLQEPLIDTREDVAEPTVEKILDSSLEGQEVPLSPPGADTHTEAIFPTDLDPSLLDLPLSIDTSQAEDDIRQGESVFGEETQIADTEQREDVAADITVSSGQQKPEPLDSNREKVPESLQDTVGVISSESESTLSEHAPSLETDRIGQDDHYLSYLDLGQPYPDEHTALPIVKSPPPAYPTSPSDNVPQVSFHSMSRDQDLIPTTSTTVIPSLSPPHAPNTRIDTPSRISISTSTVHSSTDTVPEITLDHILKHGEKFSEPSAVQQSAKTTEDDQNSRPEMIREEVVDIVMVDEEDVGSSEDESTTAPPEDSSVAVKTRRRLSLAEEMQAIGEGDYGVFDDTINMDLDGSFRSEQFIDELKRDEARGNVAVEAGSKSVKSSIPVRNNQLKTLTKSAHQDSTISESAHREPNSENAPVTHRSPSHSASRSWTRIVPPSPSPSTASSVSSDSVSETQNFSFLGKTQDFIVELNDISDESLDDQIENIIQERSIQESSFRLDSPEAPVRPPLPNRISSEKLSGINELFKKRHAGGLVAMSTPPPAHPTISDTMPRPAIPSVTFLPSALPAPSHKSSQPAKPLRGGLQFPMESERSQPSVPTRSFQTKIPASLSAPVRLGRASGLPAPASSTIPVARARVSPIPPATVARQSHSTHPTSISSVVPSASMDFTTADFSRTRSSYTSSIAPSKNTDSSLINHSWSSGTNATSQAPNRFVPTWTARQPTTSAQTPRSTEIKITSNRADVSHGREEEKEEEELETYIKITSNNPKEAARATAFLKLFHDYVETELVPLNPDASVASATSNRSQSNLSMSMRSQANQSVVSNANMSMMSAPELLMEAEQEIAADVESSDEEMLVDRVQELSIPGSFDSQPSFRELLDKRTKTRERNLANHVWGPGDWRLLMTCLDAEGGKKDMNVDPERVVARFVREMALEDKDLVDEWDHSKLVLRVTSIQTRRRAEAANPPSRRRRSSMNPSRSLILPNKASSASFTKANYRSSPLRKSQSLPSELSSEPSLSLTNKIFGFFTRKWKTSAAQLDEVVSLDRSSSKEELKQKATEPDLEGESERQRMSSRPILPVVIPPSSPEDEPRQVERSANPERRRKQRQTPKSSSPHPSQLARAPFRASPSNSASNTSIASSSFSSSASSFQSSARKTPISQHASKIQPRPLSIAHLPPRSTLPDNRPVRSPIISRRQASSERSSSFVASTTPRPAPITIPYSMPTPTPTPTTIPIAGSGGGARGKANDLPVRPRSSFESSPPRVSALVRSFESVGSGSGSLDDFMSNSSIRSGKDRRV